MNTFFVICAAESELQRMASLLLHLIPASGRVLRSEHVRRSGGGELPQVSGEPGEGGKGPTCRGTGQEDGTEVEEYDGIFKDNSYTECSSLSLGLLEFHNQGPSLCATLCWSPISLSFFLSSFSVPPITLYCSKHNYLSTKH